MHCNLLDYLFSSDHNHPVRRQTLTIQDILDGQGLMIYAVPLR